MKKSLAIILFLSASMNVYSADSGAIIGGAVGGGVGAAVGHEIGGKQGAIIGGAIGGATGAAVGSSDTKTEHTHDVEKRGDHHHDNGLHEGQRKHKKKHNHHDED